MSSSGLKIIEIEKGIDLLLEKVSTLSTLVNTKENRIEELTAELDSLKVENKVLKTEKSDWINNSQFENKSTSPAVVDSEAYNQKIDDLVTEINNCISLLNT